MRTAFAMAATAKDAARTASAGGSLAVRNLEQRFLTIQRVADAVVARQKNFFEYGDLAMRPLTLREIADELGLHESTVCAPPVISTWPRRAASSPSNDSSRVSCDRPPAGALPCSATAIRALLLIHRRRGSPQPPFGRAAHRAPGQPRGQGGEAHGDQVPPFHAAAPSISAAPKKRRRARCAASDSVETLSCTLTSLPSAASPRSHPARSGPTHRKR